MNDHKDIFAATVELEEGLAELLQALLLFFEALIKIRQERLEHEMRLVRHNPILKRMGDRLFRLLTSLSQKLEGLRIEASVSRDPAALSRLFTMLILEIAELLPELDGAMSHPGFPGKLANFRRIRLEDINQLLGNGVANAPVLPQNPEEPAEGHKSPEATLKPAPRRLKI